MAFGILGRVDPGNHVSVGSLQIRRSKGHLRLCCLMCVQIFYVADKLTFEMTYHSRRWTAAVTQVQTDTWYFLELSWDLHTGLQVLHSSTIRFNPLMHKVAKMVT